MDMATFLAQSPNAAQVQTQLAATTLALQAATQCIADPALRSADLADFRAHLQVALRHLSLACVLVPAD